MSKEKLIPLTQVYNDPESGIKNYQTYYRFWKEGYVPQIIREQNKNSRGQSGYITQITFDKLKLIQKFRNDNKSLAEAVFDADNILSEKKEKAKSLNLETLILQEISKQFDKLFSSPEKKSKFIKKVSSKNIIKKGLEIFNNGHGAPVLIIGSYDFEIVENYFVPFIVDEGLVESEANVILPLYAILKSAHKKLGLDTQNVASTKFAHKIEYSDGDNIYEIKIEKAGKMETRYLLETNRKIGEELNFKELFGKLKNEE